MVPQHLLPNKSALILSCPWGPHTSYRTKVPWFFRVGGTPHLLPKNNAPTFPCQWGTIAYQRLVGKSLHWAPRRYDWFDHCVPEQTPHKAPLLLPALSHTSRTALDEIDRTRMIQACSMRNWCLLHLHLGSGTRLVLLSAHHDHFCGKAEVRR